MTREELNALISSARRELESIGRRFPFGVPTRSYPEEGERYRNLQNVLQNSLNELANFKEPNTPAPSPTQQDIQAFINQNIAPIQIPQAVVDFANEIPSINPNITTALNDYITGSGLTTPDVSALIPFLTRENRMIADNYNLGDVAAGKYLNPETNPALTTLFNKFYDEAKARTNTSMQAAGRAGSPLSDLTLKTKALPEILSQIYLPERNIQNAVQQYLTGLQENANLNEIQNALNTAMAKTNLTEQGRQFDTNAKLNAINTSTNLNEANDIRKMRRLNMLSAIAGDERARNQSILDLPYNTQRRYNELTTPTGAVGGTTTSQAYMPNWLNQAMSSMATGMGMYGMGRNAGFWGGNAGSNYISTPTTLSTGLNTGRGNYRLNYELPF